MGAVTSELAKQLCGSSRFRLRFRGAGSVCGGVESGSGGGILEAAATVLLWPFNDDSDVSAMLLVTADDDNDGGDVVADST